MKNPQIAVALKQHRKLRNLSVQEVVDKLAENGYHFAAKTIYGWENGATQPDADTLMFLCELYEIEDILYAFGYQKTKRTKFSLTSVEQNVIEHFRDRPEMQLAVMKLLDVTPKINYLERQTELSAAAEDNNWNKNEY